MKIRIYKQVIELGHTVPDWGSYWDKWVVDSVVDDAEKVLEYIEETKKDTTSFGGGTYHSNRLGEFGIRYYPMGTMEVD